MEKDLGMKTLAQASNFMSGKRKAGPITQKVGENHHRQKVLTKNKPGLWLSPTAATDPILTLFGSTNLNARSAHLDTELSFLMLLPPSNESEGHGVADSTMSLKHQLADEIRTIRSHAHEWNGYERTVRTGTRTMLKIVEDML